MLKPSRRSLLVGAASAAGCRRRRVQGFQGYAFVANSAGQAVAVVDLSAFAAIRHIRLDAHPTSVKTHPWEPAVYAVTPSTGAVHRIDVGTLSRAGLIECGVESLEIAPDGLSLWGLSLENVCLYRIHATRLELMDEVPVPFRPAASDLSPDGRFHAFASGASGEVAVTDLTRGSTVFRTSTDGSADIVRYRRDGRRLLVANRARKAITILDAASGSLVVHLPLALKPRHFCFKPDGGELYVTGEGLEAVVTIHPYRSQIAATALAGSSPGAMAASADPDYLFVTNPASGDLTVMNIATRRVVAVVAVGAWPHNVTLTPDGRFALVLNRDSGDMAVIRVESLSGRRRRFAPLFTMVPVGSRPVQTAVSRV